MAGQGVLWQLVSGFDPLGAYNRGQQQFTQQQNVLQQLAGQEQDRALRRDETVRNQQNTDRQFGFQQSQAERQAQQWQQSHALQRDQFGLQQQTANPAQIIMVPQADGTTVPVRVDRQGNATPINTNIPQQPQTQNVLPPVPAGMDAKTWRVEQTKGAVKELQAAPRAIQQADNMLRTIDGILSDPAISYATGFTSILQNVPGTDAYRFGQKAAQLQGQAFLQAFERLKGAGAITETEGTKATAAIGRLSTAQSAKDYKEALNELKEVITTARQRQLQLQQRYSPPQYQAQQNTQTQNQPQQQYQDGVIATNPSTGERLQLRNGNWVPM